MGERSLKARFNKGASFGTASTSGSEPVMRVTLGTAKYEQAFKAVVWRLSRLPDKNSGKKLLGSNSVRELFLFSL